MNVVAHGIDLCEVSRIRHIHEAHGSRFLERVFTPAEQSYCLNFRHPATRLAGRFAVKEAVLKALGTGWRGGLEWTDIETLSDPLGRPVLAVRGSCGQQAERLGIGRWLVSITHTGDQALASVLGLT